MQDTNLPDDFREDLTSLTIARKHLTPESPAAKAIEFRQAFAVGATTIISCGIFAMLLCVLP